MGSNRFVPDNDVYDWNEGLLLSGNSNNVKWWLAPHHGLTCVGCVAPSRDTGKTRVQEEKRSTDLIWKSKDTQINSLGEDKFLHYVCSPNANMIRFT